LESVANSSRGERVEAESEKVGIDLEAVGYGDGNDEVANELLNLLERLDLSASSVDALERAVG
jgi:hypothetical protein